MAGFFRALQSANDAYSDVLTAVLRYGAPAVAFLLLFRCVISLLTFRREPETWGWLRIGTGSRLPITHWENVIGRSKRSDIVIDSPKVAKTHGVLTRYDDGSWTVTASDMTEGIRVNRKKITDTCPLASGDVIAIGGIEMQFEAVSARMERKLAQRRTKGSSYGNSLFNVILLTTFQVLVCLAFLLNHGQKSPQTVLLAFLGIMAMEWLLLFFYVCINRTSFEVETIAFFLCTMGMCAVATVVPSEALKQLLSMGMGLAAFLLVGWSLRNLERAKKIRYLAGVAGVLFLLVTLVFGKTYYGARNWLEIGPFSLQPSELSKVCFAFVGASTMDRLVKKRNLFLFIVYSGVLCGCLAVMNDFGTALIFFCAFLIIAFLRSGNIGTIALALTALAFAGVVALRMAPHALRRFDTWRHIWEDPLGAGYQQTQSLMCMVSGGLLGLGAGRGWMKNIFAADSDAVFATICEEWGLVMGIFLILAVVGLAMFVLRSASTGRSSFYTISSCTAAGIILVQVILNVLGTVDVLPLTGVTFPFVSNGGSSMICAWGLLGFIKAADTRQNASFAVRLHKKKEVAEDE